jgi:hypothetical protein
MWIDGQVTVLQPSSFQTEAYGIDVVNGDVYVVGKELREGGGFTGKYWKNGKEVTVASGLSAYLKAIDVVGTDVYVAGENWDVPGTPGTISTYWVNGQRAEVGGGIVFSYTYGVCVVPRP